MYKYDEFSHKENDDTNLDDLNASFIHDRNAPQLEPAVHQHRRTSRFLAHHKNHPSAQKDIYGRMSKNASDCL